MVAFWGAMARRHAPEPPGLLPWPELTAAGLECMIFDTPELAITSDPVPNCQFWDSIGYGAPAALESASAVLAGGAAVLR
jgi:hypothetical protein